jgi:hypothetical protein
MSNRLNVFCRSSELEYQAIIITVTIIIIILSIKTTSYFLRAIHLTARQTSGNPFLFLFFYLGHTIPTKNQQNVFVIFQRIQPSGKVVKGNNNSPSNKTLCYFWFS